MLTEGSKAPDFRAKDDEGRYVELKRLLDIGKHVVLYFYPQDDTPGCTSEACEFRDQYRRFAEAGSIVVGVSLDDEKAHRAFRKKYALPFPLIMDEKGKIAEAYGVEVQKGRWAARETFVISPDGRIKARFSKVTPRGHAEEVLRSISQE